MLAYLSVGTIERYRSWYRAARPYRLDLWGDWGEWYADTSKAGFRRLISGAWRHGCSARASTACSSTTWT